MNRSFVSIALALLVGCPTATTPAPEAPPAPEVSVNTAPEGVPATQYTTLSDTNYDGVTDAAVLWYFGADDKGARTTTVYKWVLQGVGKAKTGDWLVRTDEGHVDQFVALACLKPVHGEQAATDLCPAVTCDFRDGDFAPCDAPVPGTSTAAATTVQAPSGAALFHMTAATDSKVDALGKKVDALATKVDALSPPAAPAATPAADGSADAAPK